MQVHALARVVAGTALSMLIMVAATAVSLALHLSGKGVGVLGSVPSGPPVLAFPRRRNRIARCSA